jgi:hypothetical protein
MTARPAMVEKGFGQVYRDTFFGEGFDAFVCSGALFGERRFREGVGELTHAEDRGVPAFFADIRRLGRNRKNEQH